MLTEAAAPLKKWFLFLGSRAPVASQLAGNLIGSIEWK
jgi:hypothetical protein